MNTSIPRYASHPGGRLYPYSRCQTAPASACASTGGRVSSLPRRVSWPGFDLSLSFVASLHLLRLIPILSSLLVSPPCARVALHRVRPRKGGGGAPEAPGCRVSTRQCVP